MFELSLFPKGSLEQSSLLLLPINRGNCHWSLGVSDHRDGRLYTLTIIILFERLTNTVLQSYHRQISCLLFCISFFYAQAVDVKKKGIMYFDPMLNSDKNRLEFSEKIR